MDIKKKKRLMGRADDKKKVPKKKDFSPRVNSLLIS